MKRALVTGALGFVGRHLIPELAKIGYEILQIDPAFKQRTGRHLNFSMLSLTGKFPPYEEKFDLVVHLAANIKNVDERMKAGVTAYEDLVLDYEMCKWVEQSKPGCFIAMSSCAVDYPDDPYCIVKRNLEALAMSLHKGEQNVKILRPFSGYGFDQTSEYPFPSILRRAVARENPLTVWGGEQIRDWIHIDDLVSGIIYSISNDVPSGRPIELGLCRGTVFLTLAAMMRDAVNANAVEMNTKRNSMILYAPKIVGDKAKASSSPCRISGYHMNVPLLQHYGWCPKITLEDGIKMELEKMIAHG